MGMALIHVQQETKYIDCLVHYDAVVDSRKFSADHYASGNTSPIVPCASLASTGFFTQLLIYLHTGVQVWYGLHGAGHAGLAASVNLLDQHPAIHLHPAPQGTPGLPLPPHGALLPGLRTQGRVQGMYIQYESKKTGQK